MPNDLASNLPQYRDQDLWNVSHRYASPFGCIDCPDRQPCGGVQMHASVMSCLDFCCGNPSTCDKVCRLNAIEFAASLWEVGGWCLNNVPRQSPHAGPVLPALVPLIDHGSIRRSRFIESDAVCLPFFKVVDLSDNSPRFTSKVELSEHFRVHVDVAIILSGTDRDRRLERWWSLTVHRRLDAIRRLRDLGVELVTTPNYSLFSNVPRWENMFNMKRIALVHEEFLSAGMAAGLHVNARTEWDWDRWIEYVCARNEVTHVAYEFGTGASRRPRLDWHAQHLGLLAREVGRPLHLVVRGGKPALPELVSAFDKVTFIDTNAFTKTTRARQRAYFAGKRLRWRRSLTAKEEPLDQLLSHNWRAVTKDIENKLGGTPSQGSRSGMHGAADVFCRR